VLLSKPFYPQDR